MSSQFFECGSLRNCVLNIYNLSSNSNKTDIQCKWCPSPWWFSETDRCERMQIFCALYLGLSWLQTSCIGWIQNEGTLFRFTGVSSPYTNIGRGNATPDTTRLVQSLQHFFLPSFDVEVLFLYKTFSQVILLLKLFG